MSKQTNFHLNHRGRGDRWGIVVDPRGREDRLAVFVRSADRRQIACCSFAVEATVGRRYAAWLIQNSRAAYRLAAATD
jgi:hypothetical protein